MTTRDLTSAQETEVLLQQAGLALGAGRAARAATLAEHAFAGADGPQRDLQRAWATWVIGVAALYAQGPTAAEPYLQRVQQHALQTREPRLAMAVYLAQQMAQAYERHKQARLRAPTAPPDLEAQEVQLARQFQAMLKFARDAWQPALPIADPSSPPTPESAPAPPVGSPEAAPGVDALRPPGAGAAKQGSAPQSGAVRGAPGAGAAGGRTPSWLRHALGAGRDWIGGSPATPQSVRQALVGHARALIAPSPSASAPLVRIAASRRLRRLEQTAFVLLLLLSLYNIGAWVVRYGLNREDSYAQVEQGYVAHNIPPGTAIVGRDVLDLYLLPKAKVFIATAFAEVPNTLSPSDITEQHVPYAILNDQYLVQGYSGANLTFYDWVRKNGSLLYQFTGRVWNTYLYRISYANAEPATYEADSLAVDHPVVASSTEAAPDIAPQFLVDARVTRRWAAVEGLDNQWIYVDLGARRHIGRVDLTWERAYASSYALQVSDDAKTWTTFYETTNGQGGLEQVDAAADGRYVRLLLIKRGTPWGFSLWEMGIYP